MLEKLQSQREVWVNAYGLLDADFDYEVRKSDELN